LLGLEKKYKEKNNTFSLGAGSRNFNITHSKSLGKYLGVRSSDNKPTEIYFKELLIKLQLNWKAERPTVYIR